MQKTLIIVAACLSLVAIGLGFKNLKTLQQEKGAKSELESSLGVANKKAAAGAIAAADLKVAQEKIATLTQDTEKSQRTIADLQSRMDKATADTAELQKQLSQKDTDSTQLKSDLAAKDTRIAELEAKVNTVAQAPQQDDLKKQLDEKDLLNNSLQSKLKENESQIAELRKMEIARKAKVMRTGLEGRILAVNPSWNFVVLSLGDRNGVVNNAELLINRGGQLIGKVRVTSVEPSTSVADIVVNSVRPGLVVQPGDTVIYRGPESSAGNESDTPKL